jgi:hypothetical protein
MSDLLNKKAIIWYQNKTNEELRKIINLCAQEYHFDAEDAISKFMNEQKEKKVVKVEDKKENKKISEENADNNDNQFNNDIFNFEVYSHIFHFMTKFYTELELYLRTAILIDYIYNYNLNEKERKIFLEDLMCKDKKYFDEFTSTFDSEYLLSCWYTHFNKKQINSIDTILQKYIYAENELFNKLYIKYVNKKFKRVKLWFYHPIEEKRKNLNNQN